MMKKTFFLFTDQITGNYLKDNEKCLQHKIETFNKY